MCFVRSKRPLRFLHDLPKAQQLQQARLSLGAVVELASGLAQADRVIVNPPDGVDTGAEVRLASLAASWPG